MRNGKSEESVCNGNGPYYRHSGGEIPLLQVVVPVGAANVSVSRNMKWNYKLVGTRMIRK